MVVLGMSGLLSIVPVPAYALACPTNPTSGNGDTFNVVITGANGSCPPTYSSAGTTHYALSTATAANPYTIVLSSCAGSNCPPTNIKILGWDTVGDRCGGSKPACSATGPWTFTIDATVQASKACDTAPVKVTGDSGQPVLILEAGVGGVCGSPPTPSISTLLSSLTIGVGGSIHDTATLTGVTATAGGTVTYTLYSNGACSGTGTVISVVTVTNGVVPDSASVIIHTAGTYSIGAVYSGDSKNAPLTAGCEPFTVTPPRGVPEFPMGMFAIFALAVPAMLLLRRNFVVAA